MLSIGSCPLPQGALLHSYQDSGAFTDCYWTEVPYVVTHSQYVTAFYTTPVFKLERLILKWLVAKPSTDAQAALLAANERDKFAAWDVESRCENQLLLCDYQQRTRSWLMIEAAEEEEGMSTRLYFGSAVVPLKNSQQGKASFGFAFHALSWFHKLYSIVLLYSAKARIKKLKKTSSLFK